MVATFAYIIILRVKHLTVIETYLGIKVYKTMIIMCYILYEETFINISLTAARRNEETR